MPKPCVVSGGRAGRRCDACSFMRADKHGRDGLSGASGRSPESSVLKQCWCWGARGTAAGNGKHLCRGEASGSELVVGRGRKRKGGRRGAVKPVGKATPSEPFGVEKWRSKEISYSSVLVIAP